MFITRLGMAVCIAALATAARSEPASKRLPSGFQGMRGKKSLDYSPLEENFMTSSEADKIAAYLGLSSLRDPPSYLDTWPYTRSQTNSLYDHIAPFKRAPMGFQGMRGKKNNLMDTGPLPYQSYAQDNEFYDRDFMEKRGPMGFQGMRGKRQYELATYSYPNKRGPVGFQGMRGKKDTNNIENIHENEQDKNKNDEFKSADAVTNNPLSYTNELESLSDNANAIGGLKIRRSPDKGFFGMRGKKLPSASSFFGMRGKKGPFDYPFRGKFVGVRGKKMDVEQPDDLQQLAERLSWDAESYQKRKGPSGFLGMRGKKWMTSDAEMVPGDLPSRSAEE